jgi:hypothetical protein
MQKTAINRLKSIYYDSDIVDDLCKMLPDAKLVANLRCGKWYCKDPNVKTCYFKSTDGHNNQWDFNTRRLNIDLLKYALTNPAVIVVDSTTNRRKIYPDELSKTLPIWIFIINMYIDKLFKVENSNKNSIQLCRFIPDKERTNLIACLEKNSDRWVNELENILDDTTKSNIIEWVVSSGYKRLVPMFVSSLDLFNQEMYYNILDNNKIPIICFSVGNNDSVFIENQIDRQFNYILGAGDDEEMWSMGLTADLFWKNAKLYIDCFDENTLINTIKSIVSEENKTSHANILTLLGGKVTFIEQLVLDQRHPNMVSIRVITSIATFNKNIDIYDLKKKNSLIDIIHKTNRLINTTYMYDITHIHFICNDFRVSLAALVSIMIKFRNITFNNELNILDNQQVNKEYIRKIISYIYRYSGTYQMPRDFCKQLNKYYINID